MKLLLFIATILAVSCNLIEKPEWQKYEPIRKWKCDSMQIMNKTIDLFPDSIKGLQPIREIYLRNLDNYKAEANKMLDLISKGK